METDNDLQAAFYDAAFFVDDKQKTLFNAAGQPRGDVRPAIRPFLTRPQAGGAIL